MLYYTCVFESSFKHILGFVCLFRLAWQAMRQLHPEAIAAIQSKALFSQAEEALLAKIGSVSYTEWVIMYIQLKVLHRENTFPVKVSF